MMVDIVTVDEDIMSVEVDMTVVDMTVVDMTVVDMTVVVVEVEVMVEVVTRFDVDVRRKHSNSKSVDHMKLH